MALLFAIAVSIPTLANGMLFSRTVLPESDPMFLRVFLRLLPVGFGVGVLTISYVVRNSGVDTVAVVGFLVVLTFAICCGILFRNRRHPFLPREPGPHERGE